MHTVNFLICRDCRGSLTLDADRTMAGDDVERGTLDRAAQAELFKLPFRPDPLDAACPVGVFHPFFSRDQHNNFDRHGAGFASLQGKQDIRGRYGDWDDVAGRRAGVATESIYTRGRRP
jgi:hypothetical protein